MEYFPDGNRRCLLLSVLQIDVFYAGTLQDVIDNRNIPLDHTRRLKIAIEIAQGLCYLNKRGTPS
jgi:hypothetical protein